MNQVFTADDIDWRQYEESTNNQQHVKPASIYAQAVIDEALNPVPSLGGRMPWPKASKLLNFRPGEVTIWGGESGGGKSLITGQVCLSLCAQDEKVCIASFEMKPKATIKRMGRQWTHFSLDDQHIRAARHEFLKLLDQYGEFRDWTKNKIWLYDQQGTVQWRQVCAVTRYAAQELHVQHVIIDNLAKCVKDEDDMNGQKAFIDELCAVARDEDIHVHVVHHLRKPPTPGARPEKSSFKGSGAITDQPDNVIGVWRNHAKERDRCKNQDQADTELIILKQRHGDGWEGTIQLWYHARSQQFVSTSNEGPMEFFNPPETGFVA